MNVGFQLRQVFRHILTEPPVLIELIAKSIPLIINFGYNFVIAAEIVVSKLKITIIHCTTSSLR